MSALRMDLAEKERHILAMQERLEGLEIGAGGAAAAGRVIPLREGADQGRQDIRSESVIGLW